jgi:flagellar biosynthesis/type III secretory pathway protein FliH
MSKILNTNDYGYGYDQGHNDGFAEGYDAAVAEYEKRIATLIAEIRAMEARVNVATRKVDERG